MKLKTRLLFLLTTLFFMLLPTVLLLAQGGPGDPGDPGPDPDPAVPIDGGLTLLIAAGIGYAAKKGYDRRKKMKAEEKNNIL
jgi:hypothetical protein